MAKDRLAVVIPAYRAAATIERAVRSVFGQPQIRAQVLVIVDDEEGTTEAALAPLAQDGLQVLVNPGNLGAQKTRNRGLAAIDADYVMFLDSDDFVMGDLLPGLVSALDGGADIAFGPWLLYDEAANRAERRQEHYTDAADLLDRWLVRRRWTPPCAVLWRTSFLRAMGGWDETLRRNQDGAAVCHAALSGAKLAHSQQGCGVYVQHDSPLRISRSRATFGDLLGIAEGLLAQPSAAIDDDVRRKIIGDYFCWLADSAIRRGDLNEGRRAMKRGVQLGGKYRAGTPLQKVAASLLGQEIYGRAAAWVRRA